MTLVETRARGFAAIDPLIFELRLHLGVQVCEHLSSHA